MTPVDVMQELRAARPIADEPLRARVREIATREPERRSSPLTLPLARLGGWRRAMLVAVPGAAVLAVATAGAIGLARSGDAPSDRLAVEAPVQEGAVPPNASAAPSQKDRSAPAAGAGAGGATVFPSSGAAVGPTVDRAQRYSARLVLEVDDTDELSDATQRALRIARGLGGFASNVSYASGESGGSASLTLRVPTDRVQDAVTRLSQLGTIVAQDVQVDDLQESLDELEARIGVLRERVARLTTLLGTAALTPEKRAATAARRDAARAELTDLTRARTDTRRLASLATIELALQHDDPREGAAPPSRLDRALDQAVAVLAWEGLVLLFGTLVAAPLVVLGAAAWYLGRTLRRRGEAGLLGSR